MGEVSEKEWGRRVSMKQVVVRGYQLLGIGAMQSTWEEGGRVGDWG